MAKKKKQNTVKTGQGLRTFEVPTGHRERRGGAGPHQDRRTKRNRTRAAQKASWKGEA